MPDLRSLSPRNPCADLRREVSQGSASVLSRNRRLEPAESACQGQRQRSGTAQSDDWMGSCREETKPDGIGQDGAENSKKNGWSLRFEVLPPGRLQEMQAHARTDEVIHADGDHHSCRDAIQSEPGADDPADDDRHGVDAIS